MSYLREYNARGREKTRRLIGLAVCTLCLKFWVKLRSGVWQHHVSYAQTVERAWKKG